MVYHFFYQVSKCKRSLRLNRCLIKVNVKTLQVCLSQFAATAITAVIAFVSCLQLNRQPFSRIPFLTEHSRICFQLFVSYWRLTWSVFIIQSKENKEIQLVFDKYQDYIFDLKLTPQKSFTHSYLLILKQQTRKCKRKYNLCQFRNTLAMSIFKTLDQKLKVLISIICGTKINLKWITPSLPTLDLPPPFLHCALPIH